MNKTFKTFTVAVAGVCLSLSMVQIARADTQDEHLYFQELQTSTVSTSGIGYSIKRGFEKIEGLLMFSDNAKTGYYYKMGVKRLSEGVSVPNITLVNEGKNYFQKSQQYAEKSQNQDVFKQSSIYISQIDNYAVYLKYLDKYNKQVADMEQQQKAMSEYIEEAYKFKDVSVSEDNTLILSLGKSKVSQYVSTISNEYKGVVISSIKATEVGTYNAKDFVVSEQVGEQHFMEATALYDSTMDKIVNIKKFIALNPNQLKDILSAISKSEVSVKEKMGTLDLRDTIVNENAKLILDEFYKSTSQYLSELQSLNDQLFEDYIITTNEETQALNNKEMTMGKIKQEESMIIDKFEKLRTTNKYDLIVSLISSNNKVNIDIIEKTYKDNSKIVSGVGIDGVSMEKAMKTVYTTAKETNTITYNDTTKKIKDLLSTKQKTQKIDDEISVIMESFRVNTTRDCKFSVTEMNSIENIANYYVSERSAIYSLEQNYKKYNKTMFERVTKSEYDINFVKETDELIMSQYKRLVLDAWVDAVAKEIHKILDRYKTYSEANMELDRAQDILHHGYKMEHDRIASYWKSVYDIYEVFKSQMKDFEIEDTSIERYYSENRANIDKYEFLRKEALDSFDGIYNVYSKATLQLKMKFQLELCKVYLSYDKPLDTQYMEARNLINALNKELSELTMVVKDRLKFMAEYSSILNRAYIDMNVAVKQVKDVSNKNLLTVGTNKTYIVEEYGRIVNDFEGAVNDQFDYVFMTMYGFIPNYTVIDYKQPMSKFQDFYSDYKKALDDTTKNTIESLNILARTELDMRLYITNVNHLRNSVYQFTEQKIKENNITKIEDKTSIAKILNRYNSLLSTTMAKQIKEVNEAVLGGQTDEYVQEQINGSYLPEIESITNTYLKEIEDYILDIS